MKDFVLLHGGSHGAWCWSKLIDELEKLGHRGHAFDLPGHGEDSTPRETVTKESYLAATNSFISELDSNEIVIVGHSLAGIILPDLALKHRDRLKGIVYLAALVLQKGQRAIDLIPEDRRPSYFKMAEQSQDNSLMFSFDKASQLFFSDFSEGEARVLYERLTPQPLEVYLAPAEVDPLSTEVQTRYITCTLDKALAAKKCREWAKPLGIPVEEIESGHDVMLSHPSKLAKMLVGSDT